MATFEATILRTGLWFGEGPRWHDGRLWYSDFYDHAVHALDPPSGDDERVLEIEGQPSGLGWLPNGDLLVVSMLDRSVLRVTDGGRGTVTEHADLSPHATFHCNDMVVDATGRAYVGNFGFDLEGFYADPSQHPPTPAVLCRVDADGTVTVAADDLHFPNGMVITPDGGTLVVGESFGMRYTAFDVDGDGGLSNRRVWADLRAHGVAPDGCCLDAGGGIWVADALSARCVRVVEGGEITDTVITSQTTYACMLGGDDGRTLFAFTAPGSAQSDSPAGRIETATVEHPHAGLP